MLTFLLGCRNPTLKPPKFPTRSFVSKVKTHKCSELRYSLLIPIYSLIHPLTLLFIYSLISQTLSQLFFVALVLRGLQSRIGLGPTLMELTP